MKCPMCNVEVPNQGQFCAQCGAKLPPADASDRAVSASSAESASVRPGTSSGAPTRGRYTDVPEEVLWEGSYSPKAMIGPAILAGLVSVALVALAIWARQAWYWMIPLALLVLLWIYVVLKYAVARLGVAYKLTNQMFYHQQGVLTRTTDRVELIEIHDVTWTQGLFERMVNVGSIKIDSSDRTHHVLELRGIEDAETVSKRIDAARRGEQVRRGRRIESIGIQDG